MSRFRKTIARKLIRGGISSIAGVPTARWMRTVSFCLPDGRSVVSRKRRRLP